MKEQSSILKPNNKLVGVKPSKTHAKQAKTLKGVIGKNAIRKRHKSTA